MRTDLRPTLAEAASTSSSNLAFALRCLPAGRRHAALVFYRFCRVVDDIADDPNCDPGWKRQALEAWEVALSSKQDLPGELLEVIETYEINPDLLVAIVQGCEMDIAPRPFGTLVELRDYCWKVACAVGLVSVRIFGCQDPQSDRYALHLGYALQFTNILRDVGEDAALGRVYLPDELLLAHGVSRPSLLAGQPDGNFLALMQDMASLAASEFEATRRNLPPKDAKALLSGEIMAAVYGKLLKSMRSDRFQVFSKRYSIPRWQKLAIALRVAVPLKF
ncbi:MAG: squalene/phytoene synthase family protein [Terrimicrobiaceae bacterium]